MERRGETDLDNAARLAEFMKGEMLYLIESRNWAVLDECTWKIQTYTSPLAYRAVVRLAEALPELEGHHYDKEFVDLGTEGLAPSEYELWITNVVNHLKTRAGAKGCIDAYKSYPGCFMHNHEFMRLHPNADQSEDAMNVKRFMDECTVKDLWFEVYTSTLWESYKMWCAEADVYPMSVTWFVRHVTWQGWVRKRNCTGSSFRNIRIVKHRPY